MSCGEGGWKTKTGGQMTRSSQILFGIINVWNRPACRYLPLHHIAAPPRPVGLVLSLYIRSGVNVD